MSLRLRNAPNALRVIVTVGMATAILVIAAPAGAAPDKKPPATTTTTAAAGPTPPVISTFAGNGHEGNNRNVGDGGQATQAQLTVPEGVVEDIAGNVYIADTLDYRIRKVTPAGIISTIAGTGVPGFSGDGGPATAARLSSPENPAIDGSGNIYFADSENNRVRRISSSGIITTVAGTGNCGDFGGGGPAVKAELCSPSAVAVDSRGNLYIADTDNNMIRKVTPAGIISDFAGDRVPGSMGNGAAASKAELKQPTGVAVDSLGDVYIADSGNNEIRQVNPAGKIHTVAGTGKSGYSGDGGPATSAKLSDPMGVGVDTLGDVYIADSSNYRIRMVNASGIISTYAGSGIPGFTGDGGPATNARINIVTGDVAADANGAYFSDSLNDRVRRIQNGPPPLIPESPFAVLMPLSAALILLGVGYLIFRRQRHKAATKT